jgi:glycosylphosphatidylinositol deacylase
VHISSVSFTGLKLVRTVEFNEDLSAFHGSTLESQITYTSHAISYILSLYPPNTKIIVMGHSMGGIVAASLLPCSNISAIITMSTPYALPPARFDSRIETLYEKLQLKLDQDTTPILSLCGGASDMMITSETCILPQPSKDVFRKTVFTSALEGAWTGVRHDDMVWCHQVRWRVARAALELGLADDLPSRARVLDRWLRDGHSLPPSVMGENESLDLSDISNIELLSSGQRLLLNSPPRTKIVLLPILHDSVANVPPQLTVMVSQGSIPPVSPQNSIPLKVSIFHCVGSTVPSATCSVLPAETLKLIPNPIPGTTFPVPHEGSDESEGVVLYEARIPYVNGHHNEYRWVGIRVDNGDGRGWVVAGLDIAKPTVVKSGTFCMSFVLLWILHLLILP